MIGQPLVICNPGIRGTFGAKAKYRLTVAFTAPDLNLKTRLAIASVNSVCDYLHSMTHCTLRCTNYPSPEWLEATYAASGQWDAIKSDTSVIKSFDEAPATMLHVVVRKPAARITPP